MTEQPTIFLNENLQLKDNTVGLNTWREWVVGDGDGDGERRKTRNYLLKVLAMPHQVEMPMSQVGLH